MKRLLRLAVTVGSLATCPTVVAQHSPVIARDFERDSPGHAPSGFEFAEARDAAPRRWSVERDGPVQVLVHAGGSSGGRGLAAAVLQSPPLVDVMLAAKVRFNTAPGAAGLVWRYRDPKNYYFIELNLIEQAIRMYRMVNGNRVLLAEQNELELDVAAWHSLKVVQKDRNIRVYLSGIRVLEDRDRTAVVAGTAGLWCAGSSLAQFDDLRVEPAKD